MQSLMKDIKLLKVKFLYNTTLKIFLKKIKKNQNPTHVLFSAKAQKHLSGEVRLSELKKKKKKWLNEIDSYSRNMKPKQKHYIS